MTLAMERALFAQGYRCVAGLDEVGRGAWAGPLAAAAVLVTPKHLPSCRRLRPLVRDSKTLSRKQRENAYVAIARVLPWGVGFVSAGELDRIGMTLANQLALDRAIAAVTRRPELLLVDGRGFHFRLPHRELIDGDARVFCIAAAAIIAKVTRDRLMAERFHPRYPAYGFHHHNGYGTAAHQTALNAYGPCPCHRRSFRPVAQCRGPRPPRQAHG